MWGSINWSFVVEKDTKLLDQQGWPASEESIVLHEADYLKTSKLTVNLKLWLTLQNLWQDLLVRIYWKVFNAQVLTKTMLKIVYDAGDGDGYSLDILSTGFALIRIQCRCNLLKLCYACKFPGGARWNFNSDGTAHIVLLHQESQHAWAYGVSSCSLMLPIWACSLRIIVVATALDLPSVSEVLRFREYGMRGIRYVLTSSVSARPNGQTWWSCRLIS
jgi:hypothetical protein